MHRFPLNNVRLRLHRPWHLGLTIVAALWLSIAVLPGAVGAKTIPTTPQTSITLDGVTLSIQSPFLPARFVTASADNMTQMASAVARHPYREFQIEAIPFNTTASLESLPAAKSGGAEEYRAVLHAFRAAHGAQTIAHPTITVFGQRIIGEANLVQLRLDSMQMQQAVITEYVAEAGARLWLIRLTQELTGVPHTALASAAQPFLRTLAGITISSSTLTRPSVHIAALLQEQKQHPANGVKGMGAFFSPLTGSQLSDVTGNTFAARLAALFHQRQWQRQRIHYGDGTKCCTQRHGNINDQQLGGNQYFRRMGLCLSPSRLTIKRSLIEIDKGSARLIGCQARTSFFVLKLFHIFSLFKLFGQWLIKVNAVIDLFHGKLDIQGRDEHLLPRAINAVRPDRSGWRQRHRCTHNEHWSRSGPVPDTRPHSSACHDAAN